MADDASALSRTDHPVIDLWPDGGPSPLPGVGPEAVFQQPSVSGPMTNWLRNVTQATLTVFPADPAKANGTGVIVCPGGGWTILAWDHEGIDMARWFAARGVTAFLLKYRVTATPDDPAEFAEKAGAGAVRLLSLYQRPMLEQPTQMAELIDPGLQEGRRVAAIDGRRALELVREKAADYGVKPDRIGMVGFSAGAMLTLLTELAGQDAKPAFIGIIYGPLAAVTVPADAPPLFVALAADDPFFANGGFGLIESWRAARKPAEFHVYEQGGHGFGMYPKETTSTGWFKCLRELAHDARDGQAPGLIANATHRARLETWPIRRGSSSRTSRGAFTIATTSSPAPRQLPEYSAPGGARAGLPARCRCGA